MNYREPELSQLLGRGSISLDLQPLRTRFAGRSVMVTGAAGSIGAELCSQLLTLGLQTLVCVDHDETAMFELEDCLSGGGATVELRVDDVGDSERVRRLVREYGVKVVFHAAAYKHVALMEGNAAAAVKNNVLALRRAMQVGEEEGVEKFLLISSDKAVNPASVMGCTKRIGELMCSAWPGRMGTMSVRFGNVLGSQGSVLPVLRNQMARGGPLRVSHPEATRFFMTIREAASLLLFAFSMADRRDILVLKVGEPIPIVRLAKRIAELWGRGEEPIVFTGLRPAEKLHEELFYPSEAQVPTASKYIVRASGSSENWRELIEKIDRLEQWVDGANETDLFKLMAMIVPEYRSATNSKGAQAKS